MNLNAFKIPHKIFKIKYLKDKKPLKLGISPTRNCNAQCIFCNIWKNKIKNEKDINFYNSLFEDLKKDVFWLHITGGEPFLSPILYDILESACKRLKNLILININTNATIPIKNLEEVIKEHKKVHFFLSISLDGDFEYHKKRKGLTDNQLKILKQNLSLAKKWSKRYKNFHLEIDYLLQEQNSKFLETFEKKYPCFPVKGEFYENNTNHNDFLSDESLLEYIKNLKRNYRFTLNPVNLSIRISLKYAEKSFSNPNQEIKYYPFYVILDSQGNVYSDVYNYKKLGDFNNGIDFKKLILPKKVKISPLSCDNVFYIFY